MSSEESTKVTFKKIRKKNFRKRDDFDEENSESEDSLR